jgi:hypothetical protein
VLVADPKRLLDPALFRKTRASRVEWILALDEAAKLLRPATWDEWNEIWFRGEPWTHEAARKALDRLRAALAMFGVTLRCSVGHFVDARGAEVRALIEPWLPRARCLEAKTEARRRKKRRLAVEIEDDLGDDIVGENVVLDPKALVADYRDTCKSINRIARELRMGGDRVTKILRGSGVAIRSRGASAVIERQRVHEDLELALAVFDVGGVTPDVAGLLRCSTRTAWKFLKRHGRDPARKTPLER